MRLTRTRDRRTQDERSIRNKQYSKVGAVQTGHSDFAIMACVMHLETNQNSNERPKSYFN